MIDEWVRLERLLTENKQNLPTLNAFRPRRR